MYGLVHTAIERLIREEFGEDAWLRVASRAGISNKRFVSMDPYDDALCYAVVGAAAEELELPATKLLEAFGEYWIRYTAEQGYGGLLQQAGSSFEDFLDSLDMLHTRVAAMCPELRPPSFEAERIAENHYHLHYFSDREGLTPMVIGLVRGLAARFALGAEIQIREEAAPGSAASLEIRTRVLLRCSDEAGDE